MITLIPVVLAAASHSATPQTSLEDQLRANDQALLDATAPGDRTTWDRLLADDAVYVDENGVIMDRSRFLKELVPLPSYASGHIDIVDYQVHQVGETALVIHRDNEYETYHGIQLRAQYLMTETWIRQRGSWRLALVHVYVVAPDPPAIKIAAPLLESYVGRYQLTDDVTYVIRREGDHLLGGPDGAPGKPLLAEAPDVFFIPGRPRSRMLFQRTGERVTGFIDRREGEDLVYTRPPP
jgi:ketosteroid isomerase-like protein